MSKHGVQADDSATISVVVTKDMKNRITRVIPKGHTFSDAVRCCLAIGLSLTEKKVEDEVKK